MPIEAVPMETAKPFDRLRLALVGTEKAGKSRLAATARKPVLFFDFDNRREAVAGQKGVYVLSFRDEQWPKSPSAFNEMLSVLTLIEQGKTLEQINPAFKGATQLPRTLVWDSIQTIGRAARAFALYSNADLRRTIKVPSMEIHLSKSWDGWGAETSMVESAILRALGVAELDNIVILHETAEEAPESTQETPRYTGRVGVYPVRYKLLLKYMNEVWRVARTAQVPTVQIVPDYKFTAATNLDFSKIPPADMKPDIEYLIKKALG